MRYMLILLVVACLGSASAQVNRLAVASFTLKEEGQPADAKVAAFLTNHIRELFARSQLYQIVAAEEGQKILANLPSPKELPQLAAQVDYVVLGEVVFFADGLALGLNAQLVQTSENRPVKSAAATGNKLELANLAQLLFSKLLPTREETLQEAMSGNQNTYQAKNFTRAVQYCDWALEIAPKTWQYYAARGKAYEANDDVIRAEEDYQDAMKFSDGSANLENDISKIRPRVAQLKSERKRLYETLTQAFQTWQNDGTVRRIKLLPLLLNELVAQTKEQEKTQAVLRHAHTIYKIVQAIGEELPKIKQEETRKETLQKLANIDKQMPHILNQVRKIADFLSDNFAEASQAYFTEAMEHYKKDRLEESLIAIEKVLLLKPQAAKGYYWRGIILGKDRDYANAATSFTRAIELNGDYWEAYYNRGLTYQCLINYSSARQDLEAASRLKPDYAPTYLSLGDMCVALQENEQALANYSKALELDDKLVAAYFNRGKIYDQNQEYIKARNDYKRAIALSPQSKNKIEPLLTKVVVLLDKDALIYAEKARSYLETGEFTEALVWLNKTIEMNPDHAWSYFRRGFVYQAWQQYDKALAEYNEAVSLKNNEVQFYFQRAIVAQYLGDYTKALAELQIVLNFNAFSHAAYHRQGLVYYAQKDYYKAIESYQKAIKIASNIAQYYADLSQAYLQLQQNGPANVYWLQARELSK
jgi:tetratricopeptide (TPR) repeat protein